MPTRSTLASRGARAAFRIAIAACAARRGASSTGSSPKAATIPSGPSWLDAAAEALGLFDEHLKRHGIVWRSVCPMRARGWPAGTPVGAVPSATRRARVLHAAPRPRPRTRRASRAASTRPVMRSARVARASHLIAERAAGNLSRAAVRAMFQSVSRRTSRSVLPPSGVVAFALRPGGIRTGVCALSQRVPVPLTAPSRQRSRPMFLSSRAVRSIAFASSRMLPGQR